MDPGECLLCKSKMREGTTEFVARVGEQVVVIKNIPGFVWNDDFKPKNRSHHEGFS